MLVSTRRKGDEIIVNDWMRIRVVETGDGACSLAFDAAQSDRIRQAELPVFEEDLIQATASRLTVAK